ncbi:MAG TPA: inositol monophosphatase family protein [Oligoflexia bacterium]|nr:inositol monophosphatase family protein [Oligoflexia bacterium]HMR24410.1 inositol monophosphatase family protein [Oligoflexia bacterium]
MNNMNEIEKYAFKAASKAQDIQKRYFDHQDLNIRHKGDIDLVTQADLDSQQAIIETLRQVFPKHQFLAEEDGMDKNQYQNQPTWIIDPLDGTTNFSKKFPYFAISMAFYDENAIQFALIVNPIMDHWYTAHKGQGAYKNKQRIHVSKTKNLDQAFLVTGFPYDRRTSKNNNLETFKHLELNSLCVRRTGAAALDLAYVAEGVFDGFWELKLKPWDIAAGMLLVKEAGGIATDYSGQAINDLWKQEIIASNPDLYPFLAQAINR